METKVIEKSVQQEPQPFSRLRAALAVLIALLAVAYTAGVVVGSIPKEHEIDSVNLSIIVLAVVGVVLLLQPGGFKEALERLSRLEGLGVKLELREVAERQAVHEKDLTDINMILALVLPAAEREHLLKLADGSTRNYKGNHAVRTEVRHLRSVGLVRMRPNRTVSEMKDGSPPFDLADYMELTNSGKRLAERIQDIRDVEQRAE